ncbi:MAG: hypothetical protein V4501_01710 [Pseudomonadota bacterium]
MNLKKSLYYLQQKNLDTVPNLLQLTQLDSGHLYIAIEIAGENNFLSQRILDEFYAKVKFVWNFANVLAHLKKADLIPNFQTSKHSLPAIAASTDMIAANLEAELQMKVYETLLKKNNIENLHSFEFVLRYISPDLMKQKINQLLAIIGKEGHLGIALHNLYHSPAIINEETFDLLFADPVNAVEAANKLIKASQVYQTKKSAPLPTIIEAAVTDEKQYPKPPIIKIRYG